MNTSYVPLSVLVPALLLALPAQAQDAARGKLLYDTHCVACHYERIHDRAPAQSLVGSLAELRVEVAGRARLTERKFTAQELEEIAAYLNQSHYRFAP